MSMRPRCVRPWSAAASSSSSGASSRCSRPGATNSSEPIEHERDERQLHLGADSGTQQHDGQHTTGDRAEAPQAVQTVHHRRVPPSAERRSLHVHRHVDEDVEEQQPEQRDRQHDGGRRETDDRQEPDRHRRAVDHHPTAADPSDHAPGEDRAEQAGDARHREHEPQRADRDADLFADLGQPGNDRCVRGAVGEELHADRLQRPPVDGLVVRVRRPQVPPT